MSSLLNSSTSFPPNVKWVNHLLHSFKVCCFVFLVLVSTNAFAQTFPAASSCTSKDLELISATLPAPANDRCNCSGTRTLVLGIRNKTGSTRTSFALWGTLHRYGADGIEIGTGTPIFACAGPILKNSDNYLPATSGTTTIPVNCGESLEITGLYLAWTSASPNETCATLEGHPELIAPKCGTLPQIRVGIGVDATLTKTNASCTASGKIKVEPFGGIGPYQVCLNGGNCQTVAAGGYYEYTGLAGSASPGTEYTINITDNMNRPAAERCATSKTIKIVQPDAVSTPSATVTQPTCTASTATVHVESAASDVTYTLVDKSDATNSYTANGSGNFTSVTANRTYTLTGSKGSCSTNGDDVVVNAQPATPDVPVATVIQPSCSTATGTISVTSPDATITYTLTGPSPATTSQANSTGIFPGLAAGTYGLTATKNGCTSGSASKIVNAQPLTPDFTVCLVQPDLCNQYGSVTVNATNGSGFTYKLNSGSPQASNVFSNVASGGVTSITVINGDGCSTTVNCASLVEDCEGAGRAATSTTVNRESVSSEATVKAYPNPFNDRIKFLVTSSVAGKGSLDVYNMMGQKVKTVYTGFIAAGAQTFELSLPTQQVANLVYILRIGDKKVTGKILQVN